MSENENVGIELGVNVDGALQTLQELTTAAKAADATIQELKQHMTEQVNAAFGAQGLRPQNYEQAQGFLQRMPAADLAAAAPEIAATQQAISQRNTAITGAAMDVTGVPGAANQPVQQLLDQVRQLLTVQQQQQATGGANANAGAGNGSLARYGATPSDGGGSPWPASTPAFGSNPTPDTSQQDRGANLIGERMAQALTRSAGGLLTGGIQGAANAAGMGAAGDLVGGIAKPLMSLLGPLAASLAAGVAVGGAALGIGDLQAKYAGDRQSLTGSIGTQSGATPGSELSTAMHAGWPFDFKEAESAAAARQLGLAGVDSSQIGGGLNASMALARHGGIGLSDTTDLTGQLMASGMTAGQVANSYAAMDQAARASGVSVGRLVENLKSMNQAAGVGQISVSGLAAAQAVSDQTGMKIDIARAMSGTIGSTGTTALSQAAMLGLTPAQFEQAQKKPDVLMDSYANLARRYDVGSGGVQIAQQALSSAGFDFSAMSGPQSDQFIRKLVGEGPGAAQKYEQSLVQRENAPGAPGAHTGADYIQAGKVIADAITGPSAKLGIAIDEGAAALGNAAGTIDRVLGKYDPRFTPSGTDLSAGPNPHHIQPTRPLQGDSTAIMGPPSPYDLGIKIDGSGPVTPTALARQAHAHQLAVDAHNQTIQQAALANNQVVDASKIGFDTSGDSRFGPISGTAVNQGMAGQLKIGGASLSASTFAALQSAAQRTGVPLSVLLAQSRQEATVNGAISPSAIGPGGGYGLGQFTDAGAAVQYLGQASHELGMGAVTASNWRQMALNPRLAAQGMADYDAANLASKASGGRWDKALSQ